MSDNTNRSVFAHNLAVPRADYVQFLTQNPNYANLDWTLNVEGRSIRAHRTVLTTASTRFAEMSLANVHPTVVLNYRYDNFKNFLGFLYCGTCVINMDNIEEMLDMADFFVVQRFKEYIDVSAASWKNYSTINVLDLFALAHFHSMNTTKLASALYVVRNYDIRRIDNFQLTRNLAKYLIAVALEDISDHEMFYFFFDVSWAAVSAIPEVENFTQDQFYQAVEEEFGVFAPHVDFPNLDEEMLMEYLDDNFDKYNVNGIYLFVHDLVNNCLLDFD